ncbi:hypothetical protein VCR15J2_340200 [Vibrio coralliirubri]|nr:hypothetical protein VCR29J2_350063 [Vibrio coralliirubri]CDT49034.1 hypothetical protein VCR15J2_340200 [Vibrio coralliirubri]CDU11587.1 hypothetical protein VCR17J2_290003 [Vibrio coralliirubri]
MRSFFVPNIRAIITAMINSCAGDGAISSPSMLIFDRLFSEAISV